MTLINANVDVSGVSFMQKDPLMSKLKLNKCMVNEYFFIDECGQKVKIGEKYVKVQTCVPNISVDALEAPTNKIGQRHPAKKSSVKFFKTIPREIFSVKK